MRPSFSNVPPVYRSVLKVLHWSALTLIVLTLAIGLTPFLRWAIIGVAVVWSIGFGAFGLMAKPGPALTGALRSYFQPAHLFMLGLFDICAIVALNADVGTLAGMNRTVFLAMLGLALLHGIFHLWRHTALGDGALRNMMPRAFHGLL